MVNHKCTDQLAAMKPIGRNEKPCWNEAPSRMSQKTEWKVWENKGLYTPISPLQK